jgi:hypothetical protein
MQFVDFLLRVGSVIDFESISEDISFRIGVFRFLSTSKKSEYADYNLDRTSKSTTTGERICRSGSRIAEDRLPMVIVEIHWPSGFLHCVG